MSTRCMVPEVLEPSFFDFDFDLCLTKALCALMALRFPSPKSGDLIQVERRRVEYLSYDVNIFEFFWPVCFIFLTRLAPFCLRARLLDGVAQFAHNKVDLDSGCLQIFLLFTILCFELLNHFIFLEILLVELISKIKLWPLSLCLFWIGDSLLPIPLCIYHGTVLSLVPTDLQNELEECCKFCWETCYYSFQNGYVTDSAILPVKRRKVAFLTIKSNGGKL
ncbi:hypothetical protein DVH24_021568 [Malus domestica]|uniref:Uncharacterized protein n=1 Tax=Malus domestica TaxID=3750 RepID=A0A498JXC1_MALDO|nr:hypothetical protein DVH24_021568 [Malus domestica]